VDIGRRRGGANYFNGTIDEVKVWNRALTDAEIETEYGVSTAQFQVNIDPSKVIGTNNLSVGFMLDGNDWGLWLSNVTFRNLAKDANFKLVRFFDFKSTSAKPCTSWNESTKNCTKWYWTDIDNLVRSVNDIGAESMFALGGYSGGTPDFPNGMEINSTAGLPAPEQFAAYATAWVNHFKSVGLNVRFYEIVNEPQFYLQSAYGNVGYYAKLFNTTANMMRKADSNLIISNDDIHDASVRNSFSTNNVKFDSINFHKYEYPCNESYSDSYMFRYAEYYL
jgi:hypothetical protein